MAGSDFLSRAHPESKAQLERILANGFQSFQESLADPTESVKLFRNVLIKLNDMMKELKICPEYDGDRSELFVPSSEVPDGIPVFVYRPRSAPSDATILVYFHGGGHIVGSRDQVDDTCKMLSSQAQCIVVNVEQRLAPEHKFPAMMNDAETATKWVIANRTTIGGTEKSKVGVSGDSAGGQIAAHLCNVIPGIAFQILVYAHLNGSNDLPSRTEFRDDNFANDKTMAWMESMVMEKKEDLSDPRYSLLSNEKFDHLPPTLLIVAELDYIRDDSYEYAKKLTAAGVENDVFLSKGAIHGYYTHPGFCVELCRESYAKAVEFIKRVTQRA